MSVICDMDAGDTAYVSIKQSGGSSESDIYGNASTGAANTHFSGYLVG